MTNRYERIRKILKNNETVVSFVKLNGDLRTMRCTLKPELLPEDTRTSVEQVVESEVTPTAVRVWDLEKTAWRSFRIDGELHVSYDNKTVHFDAVDSEEVA